MTHHAQQIWLVRHGETAWSLTGQHTGRQDLPLLPQAGSKLDGLRPFLHHPFELVLTSPLQRARQTAAQLGYASTVSDDNLMEWNYGEYEGKTLAQIREAVPEWSLWTHGVPQGEALADVAQRAKAVIRRAQEASGDVLLFAHGHLLRILAACWLNASPDFAAHLALSTATISILTHDDKFPVIARWNWRPEIRFHN